MDNGHIRIRAVPDPKHCCQYRTSLLSEPIPKTDSAPKHSADPCHLTVIRSCFGSDFFYIDPVPDP